MVEKRNKKKINKKITFIFIEKEGNYAKTLFSRQTNKTKKINTRWERSHYY